ncbi:alpha/beta hydrolase [bacterium SCSIO 12643]|nr:alpha/beta hydrolase [bacterium SCSIO 12643]
MKNIYLVVVSFWIYSISLHAQEGESPKVFPFGVIETIESKSLNETRTINIYLPEGFNPDSTVTYPVIYVLDGSANEDFPHIAGLCQFMNMYQLLPKSIVVGIANVDRYRDFTYPSSSKRDKKDIPTSGGAEAFLSFLENELQPMIENEYPTNGHRTIIGQSLGGLLATQILLQKPNMFEDYIIVSPSLWWDNQKMIKGAKSYFQMNPELEKRIFLSIGKEHPEMHQVADMLAEAIRRSTNSKMELYYQPILDEDHATILHIAVYNAFKKLYPKEIK